MAQGSESSSIIRPTLHHFGMETRHLERMIDWYAKVVGMVTICSTSNAWESEAGVSMSRELVSSGVSLPYFLSVRKRPRI